MLITLCIHYSKLPIHVLYKGKKSPSFIFCLCCQQANLTLGEFQCLKLLLFKHKRFMGEFKTKRNCKYKRGKITCGENNPV